MAIVDHQAFPGEPVDVCVQAKRPVGDVIASVIDPLKWNRLIRVECQREDTAGVICDVLTAIPRRLNVALAETVTVNGRYHQITLICEPVQEEDDTQVYIGDIEEKLKQSGFTNPSVKLAFQASVDIKRHDVGIVEHGWIHKTDWIGLLKESYEESALRRVDLTRVVVSADTRRRLLRYTFPLKGAVSIRVQMRDTPGALEILTGKLACSEANVLSALLSRGGARPESCEVTMTCEPRAIDPAGDLMTKIATAIREIDPKYRMKILLGPPASPEGIIYPRHPDEIVARVPLDLRHLVNQERDGLPKDKYPIFISRRFFEESPRATQIRENLDKILDDNGCVILEALPSPDEYASFSQVSSKMWASRAGIVVVARPRIKGKHPLSISLGHEYGFLQGQGKPILLLIEEGLEGFMASWANANGINFQVFYNNDAAFDANKDRSLRRIISNWISQKVRYQ